MIYHKFLLRVSFTFTEILALIPYRNATKYKLTGLVVEAVNGKRFQSLILDALDKWFEAYI